MCYTPDQKEQHEEEESYPHTVEEDVEHLQG
jgi:hypothetical protein